MILKNHWEYDSRNSLDQSEDKDISKLKLAHIMFIIYSRDGKVIVLIGYLDDIIFTGDDHEEMDELKVSLAVEFEVKDLGSLRYFLEMSY